MIIPHATLAEKIKQKWRKKKKRTDKSSKQTTQTIVLKVNKNIKTLRMNMMHPLLGNNPGSTPGPDAFFWLLSNRNAGQKDELPLP